MVKLNKISLIIIIIFTVYKFPFCSNCRMQLNSLNGYIRDVQDDWETDMKLGYQCKTKQNLNDANLDIWYCLDNINDYIGEGGYLENYNGIIFLYGYNSKEENIDIKDVFYQAYNYPSLDVTVYDSYIMYHTYSFDEFLNLDIYPFDHNLDEDISQNHQAVHSVNILLDEKLLKDDSGEITISMWMVLWLKDDVTDLENFSEYVFDKKHMSLSYQINDDKIIFAKS